MNRQKYEYRHNFSKCFFFKKNISVGLLGGSFNPPHQGHIHISDIALKKLRLNEIWWIISPQNRLKQLDIRSSFKERMEYAKNLTKHHIKIKVLDLEKRYKLESTFKSLNFLKRKSKNTKFVWLMGSDNLYTFQNWLKAKEISKIFPVAVIERPGYSYNVINSKGALTLGKRLHKTNITKLNLKHKQWIFIRGKLSHLSSSKIRNVHTNFINETNLKNK